MKEIELTNLLIQKEKEIVTLKEENAKLQNLANEDLVLVEKVEMKEVYGKKGKLQNVTETVIVNESKTESWEYQIQEKEKLIQFYKT